MKNQRLNLFLEKVNRVQVDFTTDGVDKSNRSILCYNGICLNSTLDAFKEYLQNLRLDAINEILEYINSIDSSLAIIYLDQIKGVIQSCKKTTDENDLFIIHGFPDEMFADDFSSEEKKHDEIIVHRYCEKINADLRSVYELHVYNLNEFIRFIDDIFHQKKIDIAMQNVISKKSKSHKKKLNGFNSSLKSSQIQILYDELIKGKYIEEYTNQTHFKAIFRNKPIPSDFIPIKKLKPFTNTLFAYFISQLFQKENPNDYWSIAESCFEAKNLKQSFSNAYKYNPNNKPRGSDRIDEILTKIYPPLQ